MTTALKSIKYNTAWNLVGSGAPLLLGIITIPYLLEHLGVEAFGILTIVWALIGYFSLFDFGLGRALTQQVASSLANETSDQIPSLVKLGINLTFTTGMVGCLILAAIAAPLGYKLLNISIPLQQSTMHSFLIASLGIPLTTTTAGLRGVLEAYEDFAGVNLLRTLLGITNFAFPCLCIALFGTSLAMIVVSLIAARLIILVLHVYLVDKKMPAGWRIARIRRDNIRKLLTFGAWMTVSNIVNPLMVTADRFIISSVLGASLVAYYTVPYDALFRLLIIPGAITSALLPRMASKAVSNRPAAKQLYQRCLKVVTVIMFSISFVIVIGSHWILKLWLGQNFADKSWHIASILGVGLLFIGIAYIPFVTVQAIGNVRSIAMIHLCESILYLPMLYILLEYFGLPGAAIAWAVRVCIDCLVFLKIANRDLQITILGTRL